MSDELGFVYIMGDSGSRTVKVGHSKDPKRRLAQIQTTSPIRLQILWTTAGSRALETRLHEHFAELRAHGEWFTFASDPVEAVAQAIEDNGWLQLEPEPLRTGPKARGARKLPGIAGSPGATPLARPLSPRELRETLICALVDHAGQLTGDQISRMADLMVADFQALAAKQSASARRAPLLRLPTPRRSQNGAPSRGVA